MHLHSGPCWMDPFIKYLDQGELPNDKNEEKNIFTKVQNYLCEDGVLFKRGKFAPWLKCVGQGKASFIIEDIHQGICGTHERATMLANKIFRQGYYWPTLKADVEKFVKKCDIFQRFGRVINAPTMGQISISTPWL